MLQSVQESGWITPTPVQQKVIPQILAGQQVVGIAHTGTGKTAAYLLPLLKLLNYPQGDVPRCLILVPVHELAIQVSDVASQLAAQTRLRISALFGGGSIKKQREELKKGTDIIIGTPGRILDLYSKENLILKKIRFLVLDEADKLLDLGFLPQLNRLFEILPINRKNLLFSATMNNKVKALVESFIAFPVYVEVMQQSKTAPGVEQRLVAVPNFQAKVDFLKKLLEDEQMNRVMIFCRTKTIARNVSDNLKTFIPEKKVRRIDGNQQQQQRVNAVHALNSGEAQILVATDIAARGLDVKSVSHVINFDVPLVYDDYIHRIGRTARVFTTGTSITFCTEADQWHWKRIEKLTGTRLTPEPLPATIRVQPTPFEEQQYMNREIDLQKKKDDPQFKGAFHERKILKNKRKRTRQ